jgi:hypothetical protein
MEPLPRPLSRGPERVVFVRRLLARALLVLPQAYLIELAFAGMTGAFRTRQIT